MCKYTIHVSLFLLTMAACLAAFGLAGALLYLANWSKSLYETMATLSENGVHLPAPNEDKMLMLNKKHEAFAERDRDTMQKLSTTCTALSTICFVFAIFLAFRGLNIFALIWGRNLPCCSSYRNWLGKSYSECLSKSNNPIAREYGSGDFATKHEASKRKK